MAKPKNAPALFEVIRSAQEKQRKEQERQRQEQLRREMAAANGSAVEGDDHLATSLLRSPLFWFKGKQALADHAAKHATSAEDSTTDSIPVMREIPPAPAPMRSSVASRGGRIDVAEEARRIREEIAASRPVESKPVESRPIESKPAEPKAVEPRAEHRTEPAPVAVAAPVAPAPTPFADAPVYEHTHAPIPGDVAQERFDDVHRPFLDARQGEIVEPVQHAAETDTFDAEFSTRDPSHHQPFGQDADHHDSVARHDDHVTASDDSSSSKDGNRLALPLGYTTGILAGCGVLLLCGAVYLVSSFGTGPQTAIADQKPRPEVLDVKPAGAEAPKPQPERTRPTAPAEAAPLARQNRGGAESTSVEQVKPIAPPTNVKRVYNMQYIVVLSSPIAKDAQDAVKFLAENGIAATAEQALPGYSKSWYSVVTAKGFEKTRDNPEFEQYRAQLARAMQKYAKGSKFKNSFQPDVYTWRVK